MTNRMIENRVQKIQGLEQQKAQLEAEIEKLKNELKKDMEEKGVSEIRTDKGITVRWQEIVADRFDSKNFKGDHPDMYSRYTKHSVSHRFSWSA